MREKEFLNQATGGLGMTFKDFIELHMKDMEKRLSHERVQTTMETCSQYKNQIPKNAGFATFFGT